jgi:solute carrier family 12 sodium/potassium/chloride transporter 2
MSQRTLGTFEGVFTPTILTIIGVILYLRLGWVVGTVGLGAAILIILLSHVATVTTGLALSSMTTNVRIGAGGFYSLISRSLGLEAGAAIGLPLYFSQAFSVALYIIGFTEAWRNIFPAHDVQLVASVTLLLLAILSFIGVKAAMKVQYVIMAAIALSLLSAFLGKGQGSEHIIFWQQSTDVSFWKVFAIFFPAVTGIAAGAAMSGDLKDPKRNLPLGILSAIGIGLVVYLVIAVWYALMARPDQLTSNYTIMIDIAFWRWPVIAGIMGATLSSALGSVVGAPRVLMALAQDRLVPFPRVLAAKSAAGEPRTALLVTVLLVEASLLLGNLDSIAALLTMFFLITYGTINTAVFIEKVTGIPSFRPSFDIPLIIPLVGGLWCVIIMFLINPVFAAAAIVVIFIIYGIQVKRDLRAPWGDIRSALFDSIAAWAVKTSARMPRHAKSWKPDIMIPVEDPAYWSSLMAFVRDIVFPKGTLRVFSVKIVEQGFESDSDRLVNIVDAPQYENSNHGAAELEEQLNQLVMPIRDEGIFTAATVIESRNFLEGINVITQVMRRMFFPPNLIFFTISEKQVKAKRLEKLIAIAIREQLGIIALRLHAQAAFGNKQKVNLWLRIGSPNQDLAVLTALQLERNWGCMVRLLTVVGTLEEKAKAMPKFNKIAELIRMPRDTQVVILTGDFITAVSRAPAADLNIFGFPQDINWGAIDQVAELLNTSCLFVKDSGEESAFA